METNLSKVDLSESLVFLTGGSKGIGKALRARLIGMGADVFYTFNSTEPDDDIGGTPIKCDVSDPVQVVGSLGEVAMITDDRNVDYFIGNAGVGQGKETTLEDVAHITEVNLLGNAYFYHELIKGSRMSEGGVLVCVGSAAADGNQDQGYYALSKAGLRGLVNSHRMSAAYTEGNIDARLIELPIVETDMASPAIRGMKIIARRVVKDPKLMDRAREENLIISSEEAAKVIIGYMLEKGPEPVRQYPGPGVVARVRELFPLTKS